MARLIICLACLSSTLAVAQGLSDEAIYERINQQMEAGYRESIGEYDVKLTETPGDVRLAAERCATISAYAYSEYFTSELAYSEAESCLTKLREQFPGHPEAEIPLLRNRYDDDKINDAKTLLTYANDWYSRPQRARLLVLLSESLRYYGGDVEQGDHYCAMALALDTSVACRLAAADHYVRTGSIDYAIKVLTSPLDRNISPSHVAQKIHKLVKLDANEWVLNLYEQIDMDEIDDYVRLSLSQDLASVNLNDKAQQLLSEISEDYLSPEDVLKARFQIAMSTGHFEDAQSHYNTIRERDFWSDPLLRTRFELFGKAPDLRWTGRDFIGFGALLLTFAFLALLAAIPTAAVHYRGLVRRARGLLPGIKEHSWSLRDSLYVSIVLLVGSGAALYIFEYDYLSTLIFDIYIDQNVLADVDSPLLLIAQTAIYGLLLLPLLFVNGRLATLGSRNWSIPKCIGIGIGFSIVFRILAVVPGLLSRRYPEIGDVLTTQETIIAMYQSYGIWTTLAVVALVVPIVEESIFRGALLHGFARHITIRWANLIQAGIFAALHDSIIAFPFFVLFAYVAGHLVLRAGGLLPAIVFHATFNGGSVLLLRFITAAN